MTATGIALGLLAALLVGVAWYVAWRLLRAGSSEEGAPAWARRRPVAVSTKRERAGAPAPEKKPARRKAPRGRPATAPRYPVILAHGLFGFDELRLGKNRVEYWKGVPRALRRMGAEVAVPRFGATASVERRAAQLAEVIRSMPGRRVNVVAHSMAGVDARLAIARLGVGDRVASLVTIATPHRGTPLADLGSAALAPLLRGRREGRRPALPAAADGGAPARRRGTVADRPRRPRSRVLDIGGIRDARPDAMRRFNRRIRDDARVHYASVVGAVEGVRGVNPLLVPGYLFLSGAAGRNDGVVPEASQAWGSVLARVEADHWAVVGWSKGFDAPDFYGQVLREIAARGF